MYRTDSREDTYEETPVFTDLSSDVILPSENASLLRKWAECGNITRLLKQLTVIEQLDECYLPLVTELKKFVNSFQFQRVVEYLDHMEKSHEE